MSLLLDVDTGYDDALAILLALRSPGVRVLGITCVAGNHALDQVLNNTLRLLDLAEAPPIPVALGMDRPLLEAQREPSLLHGRDGMGDTGLPPRRGSRSRNTRSSFCGGRSRRRRRRRHWWRWPR